jgi:hypothetical protein
MSAAVARSASVRLGPFQIQGLLARGGMAEILLGERTGSLDPVVIKRMLPALVSDPELLEMFLAEGRFAVSLDHPNVVRAFALDGEGSEPLLSMEFLHGANLGRLLRVLASRDERLPLSISVEIVRKICAGLHYAHERRGVDGELLGVVHRDVSLHNVMVTFDGGVKLIDFGIAKGRQRRQATRTGSLRGTVPYMSPEQCRSEPVDRRSDVFSASILLWELTVGHPLYPRDNDLETLNAISNVDARRPSELVPGFPALLEAVTMKGLARAREERYQTAAELGAALLPFTEPSEDSISALGALMRALLPEEVAQPKLLAWVAPRAAAFPVTQKTENLDGATPQRRPKWLGVVTLVVAALAAGSVSLWVRHAHHEVTSTPLPVMKNPSPAAEPDGDKSLPSPAVPVEQAAPDPNGDNTQNLAAHRKRTPGHDRGKPHRHAPHSRAAGSFDLDGPGLPR